MLLESHRLGTKLRLALLGTGVFSILALAVAALPILRGSIRRDRIKLLVEQSTRALAETVSHHLEQYHQRVREAAAKVALVGGSPSAELRLLNATVREPVAGLLPHGILDLLVVVGRDGIIQHTNNVDRFGVPLNTTALWGRHIGEFPEEELAFLGAFRGQGKHDWYQSKMVAQVRPALPGEDISRHYAIALAEPVSNGNRVLVAVVNWEAIQKILDGIEEPLAKVEFPSGYAFMFARDSDSIIAHKFRDPRQKNNYATRLVADHHLPELSQAVQEGRLSLRYEYPPGTPKVSGLARIDDADFGWTVGLGINDADVIAPMGTLTRRLAILGGVVILLALLLSQFLSRRMTLDLRQLTRSALRIAEGQLGERVAVSSRDEIGQLAGAFNNMTAALVERDELIHQQQEQLLERARLDQEIRIAVEVQQRLLPQFRPPLATLDYFGLYQPAQGVSGDYYDFLPLAQGRLGLLVADVAGKGISAALLTASLHACVRAHAPLLGDRCGEVVATVNSLLYEDTGGDRFATLFYGVYDDASRSLTYANAGHCPPLLVRGKGLALGAAAAWHGPGTSSGEQPAEQDPAVPGPQPFYLGLDFGTPPVGIFQTLPAIQTSMQLVPGDWLVVFSDGLSEALNDQGEEFSQDRLADVVFRNRHLTATKMCDAVLAGVRQHNRGRPFGDDLTLAVARVL